MRYYIYLKTAEVREHFGVSFALFHDDSFDDPRVYSEIIHPSLDVEDGYLQSAVEQTFSEEEVATLQKWFADEFPGTIFTTKPVAVIDDPQLMGVGANSVGGSSDFFPFHKCDGWPLHCRVSGYYDLAHADSGPYVDRPELAYLQVHIGEQGKPVVKLPPY